MALITSDSGRPLRVRLDPMDGIEELVQANVLPILQVRCCAPEPPHRITRSS